MNLRDGLLLIEKNASFAVEAISRDEKFENIILMNEIIGIRHRRKIRNYL